MNLNKVCYFGGYNPDYPRNQILRLGLELNQVEVYQCRVSNKLSTRKKLIELLKLAKSIPEDTETLILAEMNDFIAPVAWFISRLRKVPLIVDQLFSIYDALVLDRKQLSRYSPKAWIYFLSDFIAMKLADHIIADSHEHKLYFAKNFRANPDKISVIHLGVNDQIFYKTEGSKAAGRQEPFCLLFFGTFIPLHGIEVILKAASLLSQEAFHFHLCGSGQTFPTMQQLSSELGLENVTFHGRVPPEELMKLGSQCHAVLGIFGATEKTLRVIPHKVYQGMAMGMPVLTAESLAIREVFEPGVHLFTCETANPEALATAIQQLADNDAIRFQVTNQGHERVMAEFTPKQLGSQFKEIIMKVKAGKPA